MSAVWSLPAVKNLRNTGSEWALHALSDMAEGQHLNFLVWLWRIWYVRNELVHKPGPQVDVSIGFLLDYIQSILQISQHPGNDLFEGKYIVLDCQGPM